MLQFVIVGVYGTTEETDIAIDSVCITACDGKSSKKRIKINLHIRTFLIPHLFFERH